MRDVPAIWDAWKSGRYFGDNKPSTRVTVDRSFYLTPTGAVVGQWTRGPARWFQRAEHYPEDELEIPGVISVNIDRSTEPDAGTCDVVIRNVAAPELGAMEMPVGQFADIGHYTPERGESQDGMARWGHAMNPWHGVLVPNALIRTYQGFGGQAKTHDEAFYDGNVVLNGVWLVDDVTIGADGTITLKCRDMAKLLIDQQLVPPLVPTELYPLLYRRYRIEEYTIPADMPPGIDWACPTAVYATGPGWHSSTDETYGTYDAHHTGHRPTDAFDISFETGPDIPGTYAHQSTYWLSEPKASPFDHVWIEMDVLGGAAGAINHIYYHGWKGAAEGLGSHMVMVSVFENGEWVPPETSQGGFTPEGLPFVSRFTPDTDPVIARHSNQYRLPRDYFATRVRLTITALLNANDFPREYMDPGDGGGYRAGARKIMTCFSQEHGLYPGLTFTGGAIPHNDMNRTGYWQVRSNGRIYAFGDARVYPPQDGLQHVSPVVGMAIHPTGTGYWTLDTSGRVVAAGSASHHGDLLSAGRDDFVDIAPTPSGSGYWLLRKDGAIHSFGDATDQGSAARSATLPSGAPAVARSIDSRPSGHGYWILWTDGVVQNFGTTHYGNANRTGFQPEEYVTAIRRTRTGLGYRIVSGRGIVQVFGDATHHGNAGTGNYEGDRWPYGLCWELIPSSPSDDGYIIQRADGKLDPRGTFTHFGSVGEGRGELRYDGNYKDYSDIIKELLLWGGFYLFKDPQPEGEQPDVYGNVESTGAYATFDPLAQEMFDKRPIIDAIRDIKAIVGYLFYIDAEGAARFEAPSWWQMGNFLPTSVDGARVPFDYMPEIDETVQLTSHSVVRSAAAAKSEIIVATEYPYASVNGQPPAEAIVQTRVVSKSAADLKGIISPFIWSNGQLMRPDEQRVMTELVDMQIWFARRTASVTCVANPLIDVNDQVRVIERQTGDVYVHYVKAISFSHDLQSGSFTMSLTTNWLGGSPYGQFHLYFACVARPQGDGYWQIAANGDLYAYGAAELYERNEDDSHLDWPVAMRVTPSGHGLWTIDRDGKVITYGDAVNHGRVHAGSDPIVDMAITPTGNGYWILFASGMIRERGDAVDYGEPALGGATLPSGAAVQAQSIESHPTTAGYWVLLTNGTVQAFNLPDYGSANRDGFRHEEYTTRIRRSQSGNGYWISSGSGIMQNFGDAPWHGSGAIYPDDRWYLGLVWDFLTHPFDGYGIQRAEGPFEFFGMVDQGLGRRSNQNLNWALVTEDSYNANGQPPDVFPVSAATMRFLAKTGSPSANNAVANAFNAPDATALEGTSS